MFACFAVLRGEKRGALRLPAGQSEQGVAAKPPPAALRRSRNAARRACMGSSFLQRRRFTGIEGKKRYQKPLTAPIYAILAQLKRTPPEKARCRSPFRRGAPRLSISLAIFQALRNAAGVMIVRYPCAPLFSALPKKARRRLRVKQLRCFTQARTREKPEVPHIFVNS